MKQSIKSCSARQRHWRSARPTLWLAGTYSLSDLGQMPIVALESRQSAVSHQMRSASCHEAGVTPNIVRYVPSSEQLLLAVETGIGAASVDQNSRIGLSPNVRLYPLPATTRDPNLYIVRRKNTLDTMQQQYLAAMIKVKNNAGISTFPLENAVIAWITAASAITPTRNRFFEWERFCWVI